MTQFLAVDDLKVFAPDIDDAKAEEMILDAEALATLAAPCLVSTDPPLSVVQTNAVRAIIRGAVLRWNEAGTGALTQKSQAAGPWSTGESYDTRQQRRGMFWPSEITQLRDVCGKATSDGAFSIDTVSPATLVHADICSVNFGGACSCGAILTGGYPLYGGEW